MKKKLVSLILAALMVLSVMPVSAFAAQVKCERPLQFEENIAAELKKLNLFKGVSETDFALNKVPTRIEALVIMLRLMGKEAEILAGNYKHPFTDVPSWATKYVGYAYENKLTNGMSANKFGTGSATDVQFLTFVLRAMGYSDAEGDFTWDNPYKLAEELGVLDCSVTTGHGFLRADCASISYNALSSKLKESGKTLADKLIVDGVFTKTAYDAAVKNVPDYAALLKAYDVDEIVWNEHPGSDADYWDNFFYCYIRGAWNFDTSEKISGSDRTLSMWLFYVAVLRPDLLGSYMNQGDMQVYLKNNQFYIFTCGGIPPYTKEELMHQLYDSYNAAKGICDDLFKTGTAGKTEKSIINACYSYLTAVPCTVTPTDDLLSEDTIDTPKGRVALMPYDSAYAFLVNHCGDCGSRAATTNLMMHILGINSTAMHVKGHIINIVDLDGTTYYTDFMPTLPHKKPTEPVRLVTRENFNQARWEWQEPFSTQDYSFHLTKRVDFK